MYQNKLSENKSIKNKIVQGLISTLEVKSNETKEHTVRMNKLSLNFGKYLNLSNSEINRLSLLSNLHDIGKITVDDKILKKSEKLNEEEWEAMKKHSEAGYNIANSSEEFALVAEEIYSHHERWDGNGYPRGLKGKEIPFLARIIFLIDTYDVITSGRPYKKEMSRSEALKELENCAGSQFDPELAADFINFIKEKY
jgi:HD-GYP domain-containing protein (c-di-GMP phosphodiesterase class II)